MMFNDVVLIIQIKNMILDYACNSAEPLKMKV